MTNIVFSRSNALDDRGFSIVEILVAIVVLPIVVSFTVGAFNSVTHIYDLTRQLNQMYAVLSACPELDRALEFNSLTSSNNCYPNNVFLREDGSTRTVTYAPVLTLTDTPNLPAADPLKAIPDSKIISVKVGYPSPNAGLPPLELRMLITRNGIGQQ
ncbi:MAG: prepilin-type N-terminal cleavage/methylation domain-containing protein [Candidatus Saccharimonadales bacterium]